MDCQEQYSRWLKDFANDPEAMQDLQSIAGNQEEINDRFYCDLSFGTAGMRGVLGMGSNRMNIYTVRRATQGLCDTFTPEEKLRGVVISYDSRRMSRRFAEETAGVLCANGVRAYLFDALRPIALLSFGVRHLNAAGGVMITASHNPAQYNGYKVYGADGAQIGPEVADRVTEAIRSLSFTDAKALSFEEARLSGYLFTIGAENVDDAYMRLEKTLQIRPEVTRKEGDKLKIVYTPVHGSGNVPVRRILKEIGLTNVSIVKEQEMPDENFSTVKVPNPEYTETLSMGIALANEIGADCVFGTDPDCDRLGVALREKDGSFRQLTGNQAGCLMLYYILSGRKGLGTLPKNGAVVKSIVSTNLAAAICKDFGVAIYDTLTGFKFIGEKIQQFEDSGEHTFLFGFEESCGYLSGAFVRDKDGINASMLIAEAAAYYMTQGRTLCDVMDEIFARYGYYREKVNSITMPGQDGLKLMAQTMTHVRENPPKAFGDQKVLAVLDIQKGTRTDFVTGEVTPLDYPASNVLYYELEDGQFVCIRPSGTEPKIKLYVTIKGATPEAARQREDMVYSAAQELLNQ